MDGEKVNEPVEFVCVKEKGRLRVRISSSGYREGANCQFPRDIRKEGGCYQAPTSAVTLARGSAGKYFYRVRKSEITIVDKIRDCVEKVFKTDEECVVCMDRTVEMIIVPCGHFCLCGECASVLKGSGNSCPLCRGDIKELITEDQIQK